MERYNVIGVIGGMGPYASLDLVKKIFDNTIANTDFAHLPVAMLSYPERLPDRASYLFGKIKDNPAIQLAEIGRQLEAVGAVVAGMPCNTAHAPAIFDVIKEELERTGHKLRLISMIEETAAFVRDEVSGARGVGILATTALNRAGLYENAFRRAGFEPILPTEDIQDALVNETIYNSEWGIKGISNPVSARARQSLLDAIDHLVARGADAVVLGCTELPLAVPESHRGEITLIDPTNVLARALIREVHPEKLKPLYADVTEPVCVNGCR